MFAFVCCDEAIWESSTQRSQRGWTMTMTSQPRAQQQTLSYFGKDKGCLFAALFFLFQGPSCELKMWRHSTLTFVSLVTDSLCASLQRIGRGGGWDREWPFGVGVVITWTAKITKWSDSGHCLHTATWFRSPLTHNRIGNIVTKVGHLIERENWALCPITMHNALNMHMHTRTNNIWIKRNWLFQTYYLVLIVPTRLINTFYLCRDWIKKWSICPLQVCFGNNVVTLWSLVRSRKRQRCIMTFIFNNCLFNIPDVRVNSISESAQLSILRRLPSNPFEDNMTMKLLPSQVDCLFAVMRGTRCKLQC